MKTDHANENRSASQLKPGSITALAELSSFPANTFGAAPPPQRLCAKRTSSYPYGRPLHPQLSENHIKTS